MKAIIAKQKSHAFGKDIYLIGCDKEGIKYQLVMTEKEIIEDNKLIAEFMGWENVSKNKWKPFYQHVALSPNIGTKDRPILLRRTSFKYHSSWDWLMPVIEKINNLNAVIVINPRNVCITTHVIDDYIQDDSYQKFYFMKPSGDDYTPIEAAWNCVVDFIKWFNQQTHT